MNIILIINSLREYGSELSIIDWNNQGMGRAKEDVTVCCYFVCVIVVFTDLSVIDNIVVMYRWFMI